MNSDSSVRARKHNLSTNWNRVHWAKDCIKEPNQDYKAETIHLAESGSRCVKQQGQKRDRILDICETI